MNPIRLTLPWPPTVNTYWRHVGGRVLVSSAGRAYREEVAWRVKAAHANLDLTGEISALIDLFPPDRRRRDIDNILKALLDSLQYGGVYRDDSQIVSLNIKRRYPEPCGRVKVIIDEIKEGQQCR
jgi:Holliday junction resolvase RusA-like endonuclease